MQNSLLKNKENGLTLAPCCIQFVMSKNSYIFILMKFVTKATTPVEYLYLKPLCKVVKYSNACVMMTSEWLADELWLCGSCA